MKAHCLHNRKMVPMVKKKNLSPQVTYLIKTFLHGKLNLCRIIIIFKQILLHCGLVFQCEISKTFSAFHLLKFTLLSEAEHVYSLISDHECAICILAAQPRVWHSRQTEFHLVMWTPPPGSAPACPCTDVEEKFGDILKRTGCNVDFDLHFLVWVEKHRAVGRDIVLVTASWGKGWRVALCLTMPSWQSICPGKYFIWGNCCVIWLNFIWELAVLELFY